MIGIKKILLILLVLVLVAIGVGWFILNKKQETSLSLSQYIPKSQFIARANTKEAFKLLLQLDFDSMNLKKGSKWSALFSDSASTGVDLLVNPWFFGSLEQQNMAFSIYSNEKFKLWQSAISDSAQGEFYVNDKKINYYHYKGKPITIYSNLEGIGLVSYGSNSRPIAMEFYKGKTSKNNVLELSNELVKVKSNKSFYLFDSIFTINDTALNVFLNKDYLGLNNFNKTKQEGALVIVKPLSPKGFAKMKSNPKINDVLKFFDLHQLKLNDSAIFHIELEDTVHRTSSSISYAFNDNFEKVEIIKYRTIVLPSLNINIGFANKDQAISFFKDNGLYSFKSKLLKVKRNDENIQFFSGNRPGLVLADSGFSLQINKEKFDVIMKHSNGLSIIPTDIFDGMVSFNLFQEGNHTSLYLKTKEHPAQWLFNLMIKKSK